MKQLQLFVEANRMNKENGRNNEIQFLFGFMGLRLLKSPYLNLCFRLRILKTPRFSFFGIKNYNYAG